jgi:hypothetical protein
MISALAAHGSNPVAFGQFVDTDWEGARAYGDATGRTAATYEIEVLWLEIGRLNDALHGRRPRGVTLN